MHKNIILIKTFLFLTLFCTLALVQGQIQTQCSVGTCGIAGSACNTTFACASGLQCFNSVCSPLKSEGAVCSNDNQCLSNICNTKKCASTLLQSGMRCMQQYDCWSGNCTNGRCASRADGSSCIQAANVNCNAETSYCSDEVEGTCVPYGALGEQCASGVPGTTCREGLYCDCGTRCNGKCTALKAEGDACQGLWECASGVCAPTAVGSAAKKCVKKYSVPPGGACINDNTNKYMCSVGTTCFNGKCNATQVADQPCTTVTSGQSAECPPGNKCGCNLLKGNNTCMSLGMPEIYTEAFGNDECRTPCLQTGYRQYSNKLFFFDPTASANEDAVYLNPYFICLIESCGRKYGNDICRAYELLLPNTYEYSPCRYTELADTMRNFCNNIPKPSSSANKLGAVLATTMLALAIIL